MLNYEEGGENSVLHGDAASETFLSEIVGAQAFVGQRHMSMESLYEYGSRVGVWRMLKLFRRYNSPLTIFAVAMAMERNPAGCRALYFSFTLMSAGSFTFEANVAKLVS